MRLEERGGLEQWGREGTRGGDRVEREWAGSKRCCMALEVVAGSGGNRRVESEALLGGGKRTAGSHMRRCASEWNFCCRKLKPQQLQSYKADSRRLLSKFNLPEITDYLLKIHSSLQWGNSKSALWQNGGWINTKTCEGQECVASAAVQGGFIWRRCRMQMRTHTWHSGVQQMPHTVAEMQRDAR